MIAPRKSHLGLSGLRDGHIFSAASASPTVWHSLPLLLSMPVLSCILPQARLSGGHHHTPLLPFLISHIKPFWKTTWQTPLSFKNWMEVTPQTR